MKLFTMWAKYPDYKECLDVWDEYVVDENYDGYDERVKELQKETQENGAIFRVIEIVVPESEVDKAFENTVIESGVGKAY